jgi:hypothetical protein
MSQFVVKGTIKSGVTPLVGATVSVVDKLDRAVATQLTVQGGVYATDPPIDLNDKEQYTLIVQIGGYTDGRQSFPAVQAKPQGKPAFVNGVKAIIVNATLVKAKAEDPFKDCRNVLAKDEPLNNPPDNDHTYFTVRIGDIVNGKTGSQSRQALLAAEPAPTWTKDFEGVTWELLKVNNDLAWKSPRGWQPREAVLEVHVPTYDITENNTTNWDWMLWETEGNSSGKYRRGGKTRKLGLYKLDYDKLRKAGQDEWQPTQAANTLGGGWVTVAVLESIDYSKHEWLIKTFLPCFSIDQHGKVTEPGGLRGSGQPVQVSRLVANGIEPNTIDDRSLFIVMPFNYDDNGERSRAIGKDLSKGVFPKIQAKRLAQELDRWSTASRSTITAFPKPPLDLAAHGEPNWPLRPYINKEPTNLDENPPVPPDWSRQIHGPAGGKTLRDFQSDKGDSHVYYSVKTGVQYVSLMNQMSTKKDLLEENSIHAMNRSNLINAVIKRLGQNHFKARYQIEVLCILIDKDPDGSLEVQTSPELLENKVPEDENYKKREAVRKQLDEDSKKLSAQWKRLEEQLTAKIKSQTNQKQGEQGPEQEAEEKKRIKEAVTRELTQEWPHLQGTQDYKCIPDLLRRSDLETLLPTLEPAFSTKDTMEALAKTTDFAAFYAIILRVMGNLETTNKKQEDVRREEIESKKASIGFDGIQVREITNAGKDAIWFPALAIPSHGKAFVEHWARGQDWIEFWKHNFAIPMGRAKAEMLLFFGMQHMTSNSQNFLIAFSRQPGGKDGKLQHLILRDIGDTLYNDYVFNVLKDLDPLYEKEWQHESADKDFGVTLCSSLGSYTTPRMTRSGASIVFFFGPFIEGDIKSHPDCAKILADWCIEHDMAFLGYMADNLGYKPQWKGGDDKVSEDFAKKIRLHAELNKINENDYPTLVENLLALSPPARWRLITEIQNECKLLKGLTDVEKAKKLVNAHDILIGAEVQCYVQDDQGKAALKKLHKAGATTSPVVPVASGPFCGNCGSAANGNTGGWHECGGCHKQYCTACVPSLEKPRGSRQAMGTYRICGCGGITEPM